MAWDLCEIFFFKQPFSMKQEQTKSHKSQVMRIPQKVTIFISLDGIANKILANPKSPWFTENCFRELGLFKRTQLHTTPKSCGIRTHAIILSTWLTLWIRFYWILSHPDFWNFVSQGTFSLNTHTHTHTLTQVPGHVDAKHIFYFVSLAD